MWRAVVLLVSLLSAGAPAPADDATPDGLQMPTLPSLKDLPTSAPLAGPLDYTPHPPISIDPSTPRTIGGRYNPATGIVAGSGTAADPYVISGWDFTAGVAGRAVPTSFGIDIFRNNGGSTHSDPGGTKGDHFVIRDNRFSDLETGIRIHGSRHITIQDNVFEDIQRYAIHHAHDHFHVLTNDITISGNTILRTGTGIRLDQPGGVLQDYLITHNTITEADDAGIFVRGVHDGTVTLSDNTIAASGTGIEFSESKAGTIAHNQITGTGTAFLLYTSTLDLRANLVAQNGIGIRLASSHSTTRIDGNHIAGNTVGLYGAAADASGNWWGAADGAGGDGGGSGDPAVATGGAVVLSPALTSPPSGVGPRP